MPKDEKEPDIVKIVNDGIVPRLDDLDLAHDYNAGQLQRHYRNDTEVPFSYIKDIDFPTMAKFSEHDVGLPGVDIAIKPVRSYVYGALASHFSVTSARRTTPTRRTRSVHVLSGRRGREIEHREIDGRISSRETGHPLPAPQRQRSDRWCAARRSAEAGRERFSNNRCADQAIAEEAMRAVSRGGAVVIDPNNGNVLAMASVPSFDPNTFIPSIKAKDWKLCRRTKADPLVNRAISALPPGSTFKLITALAGLRGGKNLAAARYNCSGGVSYGDHYFKCWISAKGGGHGTIGLADALKVSCDSYFYQYANAAGIHCIDAIGKMMGIGEGSGLQLSGEQTGNMPGPEWMQIHHPQERWSLAQTANVSIGQGYTLVSPLQLAMAYAAAANGGTCYYPRLIEKVSIRTERPVVDEQGKPVSFAPRIRGDLRREVSPKDIELVRKGLWKVVNEDGGTGGRARMKDVVVAGKTGTAQATDRGHEENVAWFTCFAPFDHPKYVIAVMVQGASGHGGEVAGPIAVRILERIIAQDEGKFDMQVAWLEPAHHLIRSNLIKSVSLRRKQCRRRGRRRRRTRPKWRRANGGRRRPRRTWNPKRTIRAGLPAKIRAPRAQPVMAPPARKPNFFERLFGAQKAAGPAADATPRSPQIFTINSDLKQDVRRISRCPSPDRGKYPDLC